LREFIPALAGVRLARSNFRGTSLSPKAGAFLESINLYGLRSIPSYLVIMETILIKEIFVAILAQE
jgi:hypothetical protein